MKIAVKLNEDKSVQFVNNTSEEAALNQSKDKGWILVDSDPTFSIDNKYQWTVRESDNMLVHTSTMMTPAEESQQNFTTLTMQNLETSKSVKEVQSGITPLTQAQLQDTQDKNDLKNGMTELTKQLASVQLQMASQNTSTTTEDK